MWNHFLADSPADLSTACTQDNPVVLLQVETAAGANFSLPMEIKVELEEQMPESLKRPLASVRVRTTLGWLASVTQAPTTGAPVTLWTCPYRMWLSHTQWLQSSLGWPSMHTCWHLTVKRSMQKKAVQLKINNSLLTTIIIIIMGMILKGEGKEI